MSYHHGPPPQLNGSQIPSAMDNTRMMYPQPPSQHQSQLPQQAPPSQHLQYPHQQQQQQQQQQIYQQQQHHQPPPPPPQQLQQPPPPPQQLQQPPLPPQQQQHQQQPAPPPPQQLQPSSPQNYHPQPLQHYQQQAFQNQQQPPPPSHQHHHQQQLPHAPQPMANYQQYPQQLPPPPPQYQQAHHPHPQLHQPPRLDQHAMPSVASLIDEEIERYRISGEKQLSFTAPATLPPLVTTLESQQLNLSLQDGGCARPCHMRSTIYQVPVTKDILETSNLEFSVVVKPFDEGEVEGKFYVPLSTSEIVRCNRCKAYVNPFSRNAQCCICNFSFETMQELDQKPELHFGSYEFRVTPEYYRNSIPETRRPHIIFAIEMTAHSKHLVHYVSKNLADVIKNYFPTDFMYSEPLTPLVGFVTYNSKITIYDVMNGGHAYVISDMTSVTESTSTSKFLVDPIQNFAEIEKFLSSLVEVCRDQMEMEQQTVLGPVVEAALKNCIFDTSNLLSGIQKKAPNLKVIPTGKMYILHSSLPTYGDETTPGRLSTKRNIDDMKRQLGTDNESKTLAPEGKYYTQLAEKCFNEYASGVELFLFPPHPRAYLNLSTIGELSRLTGTGVINKYHISSLENFKHDLQISLKSTMGFDAAMRIRTSTGISPEKYVGNFLESANLEMATVNTNSNFIVKIKYDDKLSENDLVVVQFAMIYTSIFGERRVRVHNLALTTCQSYADLYKSACCDTLFNCIVRDTIHKMRAGSLTPKAAKEQLTTRCINILASYRKHCTENQSSSNSQLILPEALKLLPVYLCGALKCDAIDGGMEMFPDDKVLAQFHLLGALPSLSQATVYPRMYSINACRADDEENESGLEAILTRCFYLAIEEEKGQCYVLENGYYLFVYFPDTDLGRSFLKEVFGQRKDAPDLLWDLRQKDSRETIFLEELLEQIMKERRRALRICIVRQARDKMENVFKTFLYEDKKRLEGAAISSKLDNASYVDILCYLHSEIKTKLSQ